MRSGRAPPPAGAPEALLDALARRAKGIPCAKLRAAAALLVLAAVTMAFLLYGGAGTFPTGAWIAAPSVPEWQQVLDAVPGYAFAQVQDTTSPVFVSSELDGDTVLTITFSETIDVTPAANVVAARIHVRESGSYAGGVTLTAGELDTAADSSTISFTLNATHQAAVALLTVPELTIEPGAVRDTSGNPIAGTFDASTAVFIDATSVSAQETSPRGMAFSSDGAKMFVTGNSGDDVNEYSLSAPFDASTATFVDATSISAQETSPHGIAFSSDGAKMFVIGANGNDVNEYSLSAPFDASTATFVDATSVSAQTGFASAMAFSSDGAKMFVAGADVGDVNEYSLSTPFDASTATFVDATSVSAQEDFPAGIAFSSDGAKMFVTGADVGDVNEYSLSAPFDASTAAFVDATSVSAQDGVPSDMAFSSDGARMFILGDDGNDVNEYALSSVYPITTTSPVFVSSELDGDTVLTITFSETIDVTPAANVVAARIHVRESGSYAGGVTLTAGELDTAADSSTISFTLNATHQAAVALLTVPELTIEPGAVRDTSGNPIAGTFDASTAVFIDATSVSAQETSPRGMAFSSDGAKMFVTGNSGDDVNEYSLSAPFDASTATFVDATSISAQETSPHGIAFSSDGAKMFVIGANGNDVNEYSLSAPFDASTATFVDATSVSAQTGFASAMAFSSDGAKMFVAGADVGDVNEYSLSTPFDASTATFVDATSVSAQEDFPAGIAFSSDGAKMFVTGADVGDVNEYSLSAPFDASTAAFVDATSVSAQDGVPSDMAFSSDGARMFILGDDGNDVNEYALSSVYPITTTSPVFVSSELDGDTVLTITFSETIDVTPAANVVAARIHVRESGSYAGGVTLTAGELDTAADSSTISFTLNATHQAAVALLTVPELTIEPGAVRDTSGNPIAGTFDASTAVFIDATSVSAQETSPRGMAFSSDGAKMFVTGNSGDDVNEYSLSAPFDASTATFVDATSISAQETSPHGIAFSSDGAKMFVIGANGNDVNEYSLSAPFDASTATFVDATSVSAQTGFASAMAFSSDGAKMFVAGADVGDVNEYSLSTPFDASTATFVDATSVSAQEDFPAGIAFSSDGAKMFVTGADVGDVNEYSLSAPFDASTAAFVDATSVSAQDGVPSDMAFSSDGARMFILGDDGNDVNEYALSSVYPITVLSTVVITPPPVDPTAFVTTWETTGANQAITIPVGDATGNYTVHWGDGNSTTHVTDATHTYAEAGNHTVSISGNFTQIRLAGDATNAAKLQSIDQWGNITWTTMESAFEEAVNMTYNAADAPDLSGVDSMIYMFYEAHSFNGNLSGWDVSSVTDMNNMFRGASSFSQTLNDWNVSSVTGMEGMFRNAASFNQPLNDWNVSSVTNMLKMFLDTTSFNQPISDWDVSSVTDMEDMFRGAAAFNQDISTWDVSSVRFMGGMFTDATNFDQNLGEWYVVLNSTEIDEGDAPGTVGTISAQNQILANQATYGIGAGGDSGSFNITGGSNLNMNISSPAKSLYTVNITSAGSFGTNNHRVYNVTVTGFDTNSSPVVGAGADQTVDEGDTVTLSGTASDSDGDPLTYMWTHDSALSISLADDTALSTTFTAPAVTQDTTVTFTLAVSDDTDSVTDMVSVTITDTTPGSILPAPDAGLNLVAADSITDTGTLELLNARGIATFESGGSTYAVVAAYWDSGVQILDITDPSDITAAGSIGDTATLELSGAWGIATFESGGSTYAAVAAYDDDGVQILDIADPSDIIAAGSITDTAALELYGAYGIATFESGGSTYAAVTAFWEDGVQILDITDPSDITAAGSIGDTATLELSGASGIATFESGGSTYAAVASSQDDGVQILDITDPSAITAAGSITDTATLELYGAYDIATFESGGSTYAAVAAFWEDGVQILDITDPSDIIAAGSITDTAALELYGATGITTFESGGSTYAAVAAYWDDGVQILDITDPSDITAAGSITDTAALELYGAEDIAVFESGGSTYAAVAAYADNGVQILRLTDGGTPPVTLNSPPAVGAGDDQEVVEGATVTLSGTASDVDPGDTLTYLWTHDGALTIAITGSDSLSASFTAPDVAANTTITVTLTVSDGTVEVSDALQVTIADSPNSPPAVGAGADQEVVEGATVTLSGTASDVDPGDTLTYLWTHDGALTIAITGSDSLSASFTAPDVAANTTITVTLTVSDGTVEVSDALQVTIADSPNSPPAVGAGADQEVVEGATVTLSGTASDDDPGDTLTYEWTHDNTLAITFADPAALSTTFTAPGVATDTTITVTLTVNDGTVEVSDALQVTIADSPSIPPAPDAGLNLTAAGSITDTGTLELLGARAIATFESGSSTYAVVIAYFDNGVQVLDVTDPSAITAAGSITDDAALKLAGASGIAVFESGGSTYAAVASLIDDGVQILDVTDPSDITAAGSITNTDALELDGALGIATFESGGSTYAAVASFADDGVQILDITDPSDVTAAGSITDTATLLLDGARAIVTFKSGGSTYAAAVSLIDDGVQILDVTDPSAITAAGNIGDTATLKLDGAYGITVFESGGSTYAAVASSDDSGVQILDITDPSDITAAGGIADTAALKLAGASGIATFESGGSTYAAVASYFDNGVQILDVTDPSAITAAGGIGDDGALELAGAEGIATFESGGSTYAAVASSDDSGVQILRLTGGAPPVTPNSPPVVGAGDDQEVAEGATVTLSGTASDDDPGDTLTYSWTHDGTLAIAITGSDSLSASFTAPDVAANTTITVTLTVSDGTVEVSDALQVTIADSPNSPPEVGAGDDQEVAEGATVTLSGTASDDDPGDTLTYLWTHDGALAITITGSDSLSASFTAPDVAADTTITVTLTVDDGTVEVSDALQVTIADSPNSPPVVGAGDDQEVVEGATVTLSGTASDVDPGDTLTYLWTHDGALAIAITGSDSLSASFTAPDVAADTTITVTLTVDDGTVEVSDALQVTIADLPSIPPAPDAGLNLTAAGSITDTGTLELLGARAITTFESGGSTYAAVIAYFDNGVQILDITDPSDITAAGGIGDTATLKLAGASGIATFESGGSTYAAVASLIDDGVQILDVTDPSDITAAGGIADTAALELDGARGITTFESGGSTYAAVASFNDDGVQILDVTDPSDITAAGGITDTATLLLDGARAIATFESGGSTYAAVASFFDHGVQILDVTDPSDITAADNIADASAFLLHGAYDITVFKSGGSTYAAVASSDDNGVQILDVTDPSDITAAGNVADTAALKLAGASGITTFESGGSTYAAVASYFDNGVQILDVTDPSNVTAADSIGDDGALELAGAEGIAIFESGGSTYAAVASSDDSGVQILRLTGGIPPR